MLRFFRNLSENRSELLRRSGFGHSGTPCSSPSRRRGCGILFPSFQAAAAASWAVSTEWHSEILRRSGFSGAATLLAPRRRRHPGQFSLNSDAKSSSVDFPPHFATSCPPPRLFLSPPPMRWHPWHLPLSSSPCLLLPGRGSILVIFPWAGRHLLVCVCDPVPFAPMVPDFLRGLVSAPHYLHQVLNVTLSEQETVHVPQIVHACLSVVDLVNRSRSFS